jgi:hypothetical protein
VLCRFWADNAYYADSAYYADFVAYYYEGDTKYSYVTYSA